ncbi:hypothetical protein PCANC_19812 [Puccinia coronata f. sp. avenae]|uniref:Uncharacterized protein n=1 Tax=Puccinia coronata f. sp. avenae TaxID=200324 RepID=A0A2N5UPT5_9BASI|nr:hypothetical protein PCANC_19812 [Puccinia coronata f. sp. avenae]
MDKREFYLFRNSRRLYNLVSQPNQSPLQKTLCLAMSSMMPGTQPSQLLTPLFSPDEGTMALTTGIIYDVQGDVQLLDDAETYAFCFNPSRALPSPPITPRTTTEFTSQVLVPFLKSSSSTRWGTLACSSLWFHLAQASPSNMPLRLTPSQHILYVN